MKIKSFHGLQRRLRARPIPSICLGSFLSRHASTGESGQSQCATCRNEASHKCLCRWGVVSTRKHNRNQLRRRHEPSRKEEYLFRRIRFYRATNRTRRHLHSKKGIISTFAAYAVVILTQLPSPAALWQANDFTLKSEQNANRSMA